MSCTVKVVPMSAPRMMPSVWRKLMSPADTKPINMSVVAADDWMIAVIAAPDATASRRFFDIPVSSVLRRLPAALWSASPLRRMP